MAMPRGTRKFRAYPSATVTTSPGTPSLSTSFCRMIFIAGSAPLPRAVRQERHLPRVLDRRRHVALVLRAVARHPARPDLAPLRDELPEQVGVLVVDVRDLVLAELAELPLAALRPALFFFGVLAGTLLGGSIRSTRHPVVSPRPRRRRRRRGRPCCWRSSPRRRTGPASPPWRWPIAGSARSRRLRSRSRFASRRPGSPRNVAAAARPRSRWRRA